VCRGFHGEYFNLKKIYVENLAITKDGSGTWIIEDVNVKNFNYVERISNIED